MHEQCHTIFGGGGGGNSFDNRNKPKQWIKQKPDNWF